MREVKVSPCGDMVAVRSDAAPDAWNAWGVMSAINGGHWSKSSELESWAVATVSAPPAAPEPDPVPEPEPPVDPDE
jgi:hypothetical protein